MFMMQFDEEMLCIKFADCGELPLLRSPRVDDGAAQTKIAVVYLVDDGCSGVDRYCEGKKQIR